MFINEFGDRDDPTVILLTAMMIFGAELHDQMTPYFHGSHHIIALDQGGRGKAGAYVSADEECRTLKSFLIRRNMWKRSSALSRGNPDDDP